MIHYRAADEPRVRILVADDEPLSLHMLQHEVNNAGFEPVVASDGAEAIAAMTDDIPIALVDLKMPKVDGLGFLAHCREHFPHTQVIVVSGAGEMRDAIDAMKRGAFEYLTKPFDPDELLINIESAIRAYQLAAQNRDLKAAMSQPLPASPPSASGVNAAQQKQLDRIAQLDSTVLLTGESGTGKSTLARLIHQSGSRSDGPFVVVNCASLPRDLIESELFGHRRGAFTGAVSDRPGRAEMADGGTLFLDEIGDLPLDLQPKLLTFLQDRSVQRIGCNKVRSVDVRVIAATHQNLEEMCQQNRFRLDLFYRLNVLGLTSSPLRTRRDEIKSLAGTILNRICDRRDEALITIDREALDALQAYRWPGNIRELENVLERASAFCDDLTIRVCDLLLPESQPAMLSGDATSTQKTLAGMTLSEIELQAIVETLEACSGNKARTARELGISEKSIYNKMRRHGLLPAKK